MASKNQVDLVFDNTIRCLAGYDYGVTVFDKQIKEHIDLDKSYFLHFPKNIISLSTSFVQGLFAKIIESIGKNATIERTNILSENDTLKDKVLSNLV